MTPASGSSGPTPKLRFPEFAAAGDWRLEPLGNLVKVVTDRVGSAATSIPMSITSGVGLVSQKDKFGRTIAGESFKNYIQLKTNDFAYNKSATKYYPQGYIALYSGTEEAAVPGSIFTCFRPNLTLLIPKFLDRLFYGNHHGRWLRKFITVGARANGALSVSDDDLMSMPVLLPPEAVSLDEQRKIADCLNSLDDLIAVESRRMEALRRHKQGLMRELFPQDGKAVPAVRFPEFNMHGSWKEELLDDLAKRGSGHTPNKMKPEYWDGRIRWLSLVDSAKLDKGLIAETDKNISEQGLRHSSAVLHPAGAVVLTRDAGVGKSAVLASPMAVSQHFIAWACEPTKLSNWFLYYQLQRLKPLFENVAMGSTIKTIGLPFFKSLRITVPPLAEQQRIADCLLSVDDMITAQARYTRTLEQHKQGLLQQLLPSLEQAA